MITLKRPLVTSAALVVACALPLRAQNNWMYYGQDQGASKYSTLSQINADNVSKLTRAWTFHTGNAAGFFESTPLVIDGTLYFAAGNAFFALDAITGTQIWKYSAPQATRRGVSYWPGDARTPARIYAPIALGRSPRCAPAIPCATLPSCFSTTERRLREQATCVRY